MRLQEEQTVIDEQTVAVPNMPGTCHHLRFRGIESKRQTNIRMLEVSPHKKNNCKYSMIRSQSPDPRNLKVDPIESQMQQ